MVFYACVLVVLDGVIVIVLATGLKVRGFKPVKGSKNSKLSLEG
jgi:hypothetical protein